MKLFTKPLGGLAHATDTTWELAVIGTAQDASIAKGVGIFRDIEAINLDGLPEAEAEVLKATGMTPGRRAESGGGK